MKESIPRGSPGIIHPISGSYVLLDDNGNIRIGTEEFGDAIYIKGTTGHIYLNANKLHMICDEIEWNELVFNKAATNPSQATLKYKQTPAISQELARYGKQ
jgi:hypothetical protein